jgi:CRP-like cAMP-binding protein
MSIEKAVEILASNSRTNEDLDYLSIYLRFLEDFRRYIDSQTLSAKREVCRNLQLEVRSQGEKIFDKGDPSDCFYIILSGSLDAYNVEKDGSLVFVGNIPTGKQLGERGVIRGMPRSLTIIANQDTLLLKLSANSFRSIFGMNAYHQLEERINFINTYFPNISRLTQVQKERIVYTMTFESYKRGQVVIDQGACTDFLYFVIEGEMRVMYKQGKDLRTTLVKIGRGNCFGEEGALFNKKSNYEVSVSGEHASVFMMRKTDIYSILPEETIKVWKENFKLKDRGRNILGTKAAEALRPEHSMKESTSTNYLPQASKSAQRRISAVTDRNRFYSGTSTNSQLSKSPFISSKQILEKLRDCSPKRLLKSYSTCPNSPRLKSTASTSGFNPSRSSIHIKDLRKIFINQRGGTWAMR